MISADAIICDALTGRSLAWPADAPDALAADVVERAVTQGVAPLLARAIRGCEGAWPMGVRGPLDASAAGAAVLEHCRGVELRQVMGAFAARAIDVLLIKGAGLSYVVYDEPWLRSRRDTDLLVRPEEADAAACVLREAGYTALPTTSGRYVSGQNQWIREDAAGLRHAIDLHWRVFNPQAFAAAFSFDDLWRGCVAIPALGAGARTPCAPAALLLACVHRVAHHYDSGNLLWLYDIHRLACAMTAPQHDAFIDAVTRTGTTAVCASGLTRAQACFGGAALEALCRRCASDERLPRAFAGGHATQAGILMSDIRMLGTWRARAALVREHLFPPPSYMRTRHADAPSVLLPWLYVRRIALGAGRWCRPFK